MRASSRKRDQRRTHRLRDGRDGTHQWVLVLGSRPEARRGVQRLSEAVEGRMSCLMVCLRAQAQTVGLVSRRQPQIERQDVQQQPVQRTKPGPGRTITQHRFRGTAGQRARLRALHPGAVGQGQELFRLLCCRR